MTIGWVTVSLNVDMLDTFFLNKRCPRLYAWCDTKKNQNNNNNKTPVFVMICSWNNTLHYNFNGKKHIRLPTHDLIVEYFEESLCNLADLEKK